MSRADKVMGHGDDNDGIEEYDNALPAWWLALFGLCILWGVGYAIEFHFISQRSQASMYERPRWPWRR